MRLRKNTKKGRLICQHEHIGWLDACRWVETYMHGYTDIYKEKTVMSKEDWKKNLSVRNEKRVFIRTGGIKNLKRGDILVGDLMSVPEGHPSDNPRLEDSSKKLKLLQKLIEEAKEKGELTVLRVINPAKMPAWVKEYDAIATY